MAKQSALDALQLEVQGKEEHAGFRRRQAGERQHYGSHEFCYHQRQQRQAEAETQSYVANELLGYYPRTELDSLLTATLTQYWTSGRTQTEIDDAVAGLLDQATADARYLVRPPGPASGTIFQLVQNQFFPPIIRNLLLRSPLTGANVLGNGSTLEINCDCWSKSEADSRYISTSDLSPLDARYFVREPFPEGNGIFSMVHEQFTPRIIRSLLCRSPLSAQPILGNGSTLELECNCWSKAQSDGRYPLVATFNSLGSTVTSIDGRVSTLESQVGAIDGRVTGLENSGGVAPTADLTVNSLTDQLRGDAPAAERSGRPPDPERPGDRPQGRRRAAGQLCPRRHQPG